MLPASTLREVIVFEQPIEEIGTYGQAKVVGWQAVGYARASIQQDTFYESQERGGMQKYRGYSVRVRWNSFLTAAHRIRWESRENRILNIASIIERGYREEFEIIAQEEGVA